MAGAHRTRGFTLLEMMVVMILLGIVAGLGFAGFDRMDPGSRGLQVSLETFLEASRDRARGSGQEVRVSLQPALAEEPAHLVRHVFRSSLEAGFEPRFAFREGVSLAGGARLGQLGRCGGGLDLSEGGSAVIEGRGGNAESGSGFTLEFDFLVSESSAGRLADWEGLLSCEFRRGGGLGVRLRAGEGEFLSWVQLEAGPEYLRLGRWQRLRFTAADGMARLWLDGVLAASDSIGPVLGQPTSSLRFGSDESTFRGQVDEVLLWSRLQETGPEIPEMLDLVLGAPALIFDRHGRLSAAAHPTGVPVKLLDAELVVGSFLVGRFTQEVLR